MAKYQKGDTVRITSPDILAFIGQTGLVTDVHEQEPLCNNCYTITVPNKATLTIFENEMQKVS